MNTQLQISKHCYLQTANTEQQTRNTKWNYGIETYSKMMKCRSESRIANQTTTSSNRQNNEEEALTEPVKNVCSFNNYKHQTYNRSNRQTREEEALTKQVNNVCSFNGGTRMKQTLFVELAVDKQDSANSL